MLNLEKDIRCDVKQLFSTPASIIWDIENINMPKDIKVLDVKNALLGLASTYNCNIDVFAAIGSTRQFRDSLKMELFKNDILFKNVTSGKKNAADMSILYYIMKLKDTNPPPYKIILITGDSDFTELVYHLRSSSYEVILVHLNESRKELVEAATYSISWTELIKPYLVIEKEEEFVKKRTISGSSTLSSNLDTTSDSTYNNADTCIVKFYTTGRFDYYSIPSDIKVNVGDIVKVEDFVNCMNAWNIGEIVKVLYEPMVIQSKFNIINVVRNKHFDLHLDEKVALDVAIFEICREFHKDVVSAELRWDKQNITVYHKYDPDIDFTRLKITLKKIYKISVVMKSITVCSKQKCINRYCKFYHIKK
jgi:hypothetical protein